jgi:two-component system, chemotaxis family, protein-glutamate methylesterase/glutaminase
MQVSEKQKIQVLQMVKKEIKVLLVDDSEIALTLLKRLLSIDSSISIVGMAKNGMEALDLIPKVQPDIVCTDYYMPLMDGLELTKKIMALYPLPILVISGILTKENRTQIFALLDAGALDVLEKPQIYSTKDDLAVKHLVQTIKVLASTSHIKSKDLWKKAEDPTHSSREFQIVVMGASTGGPIALKEIINSFPSSFPIPILCIQHMSPGFLEGFVDWLKNGSKLTIKIMQNGEVPLPGTIYFPQENHHMEIDGSGKLIATTKECLQHHRPSISVTMSSAAQYYGSHAIGILLTGMGSDGAKGMAAIYAQGGFTIVQTPSSCVVASMPEEVIKLRAARLVLSLAEIGPYVLKINKKQPSNT